MSIFLNDDDDDDDLTTGTDHVVTGSWTTEYRNPCWNPTVQISIHSRFLCSYFNPKILKGSLQPKSKRNQCLAFNACNKVSTG